jgi:hypothetical protein
VIRRIVLRILFTTALLPLMSGCVRGQQNAVNDDLRAYVQQCRTIEMVLGSREAERQPGDDFDPNDDFTVAGEKCGQLQAGLSAHETGKVRSATAELRPILARLGLPPTSPQEQLAALEKASAGLTGVKLQYELPDLAKRAFEAGETERAKSYATQLLEMASQHRNDWNYGNAIFYGNFVLGRIAVRQGDLTQAGQYLLASAATPGSPQLDSFGPNMTLAKELLEKRKSEIVLQYFAACKKFWEDDHGKLDKWIATVRSGGDPDFGANLRY